MKKIIMLFVASLYTLQLHADINAEYQEAIESYKKKEFSKSYTLFSKLYLSKLSDAKLNFYLGRSAYEVGEYEVALAAFERVAILDSGNLRNQLEMARTYFMLGMYADAQNSFESVLANPNIPQNVRTNIELYLAKVTKVQEKSFTYVSLDLDWLYDSNVNYGSLDSEYNINAGGSSLKVSSEKREDSAVTVGAALNNIYDFGDKGGFALKNSLDIYAKTYFKEHDYDVGYVAYVPELLYKDIKSRYSIGAVIDRLYLGSKSYMQSVGVVPKLEYLHTTTLRSICKVKLQQKFFLEDRVADLDANHYELSYELQNILSPRSYVHGGLRAIDEQKLTGKRVDVDYREYRFFVSYAKQFNRIYGASLFGELRERGYSDFDPLFSSKREDIGTEIVGKFNAELIPQLNFTSTLHYSRVESNQARYSYEKYTLSLGLRKTF